MPQRAETTRTYIHYVNLSNNKWYSAVMNTTFYEPQSHTGDGTSAVLIGLYLEASFFGLSVLIFLTRNKKLKVGFGFFTLLLECVTTFYFLSLIDDHHKVLRNENPACNVLLDTNTIKLEGYTNNTSNNLPNNVVAYEMSGCNFFLFCGHLDDNRCSIGNAIAAEDDGVGMTNVTLIQDDWLKSSVCNDLNDYYYDDPFFDDPFFGKNTSTFGIIDRPSSSTFDSELALAFQALLFMLAISYYLYAFFFEILVASEKHEQRQLTKRMRVEDKCYMDEDFFRRRSEEARSTALWYTLWEQFTKLYILPVTVLSVLPDIELGCDHIIAGANSLGWGGVISFSLIFLCFFGTFLHFLLLCGSKSYRENADQDTLSNIMCGYGALILGVVGVQLYFLWPRLTFTNVWMLFLMAMNLPVFSLHLNLPHITALVYFSFQMGRLLRFTQKIVFSMMEILIPDSNVSSTKEAAANDDDSNDGDDGDGDGSGDSGGSVRGNCEMDDPVWLTAAETTQEMDVRPDPRHSTEL